MEKTNSRGWDKGSGSGDMEVKDRIVAALNYIQKLTIPRSKDWDEIEKKKEAVREEKDEKKLAGIYTMLRETLMVDEKTGESPSLKVKMPDGTVKEYKSLSDFYQRGPADAAGVKG